MALLALNRAPSPRLIRQFGLIFLPAFLGLIGLLAWWRGGSWSFTIGCWALAIAAFPITLWKPGFMRGLWATWIVLTYPIAWTISHLALLLAYGLAIVPLGLLVRTFGKDPLERRRDPSRDSYWFAHNPGGDRSRYFRQY